jgi:hypothetical protein
MTMSGALSLLLPALLLALIGVLGFKSMGDERAKLMKNGERAVAEIVEYIRDGDFLRVRYRFTPNNRSRAVECDRIISPLDERLPLGSKVPVRYKPGLPIISILEPYARTQFTSP